jgi:hypothetical protein
MGEIWEELELKRHEVWNCTRKIVDMGSIISPVETPHRDWRPLD